MRDNVSVIVCRKDVVNPITPPFICVNMIECRMSAAVSEKERSRESVFVKAEKILLNNTT